MNRLLLLLVLLMPFSSWALQQSYELADVHVLYDNGGFVEASVRYRSDATGPIHGAAFHLTYDIAAVERIEIIRNQVPGFLGMAGPARHSAEPAHLAAWFDPANPLNLADGDELLRFRLVLAEGIGSTMRVGLAAVASPGYASTDTDYLYAASSTNYSDTDGDNIDDSLDNCQAIFNPGQEDYDQDQIGDACDNDDDNDGYPDLADSHPINPNLPENASRSFVPFLINLMAQMDSDGDGLIDTEELRLGTDRYRADTDGDTLFDGREVELGTDPLNRDSDRDGFDDGIEIKSGTDPNNASQKPEATDDSRFRFWYLILKKPL